MSASEVLRTLEVWHQQGWLRRLDVAFARFILECEPTAPATLIAAAAWLAHLEGRGHAALPVNSWEVEAPTLLAWPEEGMRAVRESGLLKAVSAGQGADPPTWCLPAVVESHPIDDTGSTPLVLDGHRLYLRRYWRSEGQVAAHLLARCTPPVSAVAPHTSALLQQLFPSQGQGVDWQRVACALALRTSLTIITGGPGTGKTYTAARLLAAIHSQQAPDEGLRVALAAPTGKAAARLRQSIQQALASLRERLGNATIGAWADRLEPAKTLHALLGTVPHSRRFRHDATQPLECDLLIVDEASMVHLEMMAALLAAVRPSTRLILLGDPHQLASVEAGAVLADLCAGSDAEGDGHGYHPELVRWIEGLTLQHLPASSAQAAEGLSQHVVQLRRSQRFDGAIGQLSQAVHQGHSALAERLLDAHPEGVVARQRWKHSAAVGHLAANGRAGAGAGAEMSFRPYLEAVAQGPASVDQFDDWASTVLRRFDAFRVLTALREGPWGVAGLNVVIQAALAQHGLLQPWGEWYAGRPVMITRNDPSLGLFNGDVGVVLPAADGAHLRCCFLEGERLRSVAVGRLVDVETAFAMTVHKSQGSEFAHVVMVLPPDDSPVLTRELVYTGITRARAAFTLITPDEASLDQALHRRTQRVSGLRQRLAG